MSVLHAPQSNIWTLYFVYANAMPLRCMHGIVLIKKIGQPSFANTNATPLRGIHVACLSSSNLGACPAKVKLYKSSNGFEISLKCMAPNGAAVAALLLVADNSGWLPRDASITVAVQVAHVALVFQQELFCVSKFIAEFPAALHCRVIPLFHNEASF